MGQARKPEGRLVSVAKAQRDLPSLLARVAAGEEIVIVRSGKALARISPVPKPQPRKPGSLKNLWPHPIPYSAFAPLEGEELAWWEGKLSDDFGVSLPPEELEKRRIALGFAKAKRPKRKAKA